MVRNFHNFPYPIARGGDGQRNRDCPIDPSPIYPVIPTVSDAATERV